MVPESAVEEMLLRLRQTAPDATLRVYTFHGEMTVKQWDLVVSGERVLGLKGMRAFERQNSGRPILEDTTLNIEGILGVSVIAAGLGEKFLKKLGMSA